MTRIAGGSFTSVPDFGGVASSGPSGAWAVGTRPVQTLVGLETIADYWDGARWNVVYPPTLANAPSGLRGVSARTADDVWAVGFGGSGTLVEHWNGTAWTIVPSPHIGGAHDVNDFAGVAAFAPNVAFAVGHTGYQQTDAPLVERWNGSRWTVLKVPGPARGSYQSVSGSSASDVWAVGENYVDNRPLVAHFDGTSWRSVAVPVPPHVQYTALIGVAARAANDVWAVGGSSASNGLYRNLVEHWNGSGWSIVPSPNAPWLRTQTLVSIAARSANDAWAVGSGPVAVHWDGRSWSLVDTRAFAPQSVFGGVADVVARTLIVGAETQTPIKQLFAVGDCR